MIKFKQGETPEIFYKIDGDSKQSFSKNSRPKTSGAGYYKEMLAWVAAGNTVESQFTAEELADKVIKDKEQAVIAQRALCKKYLAESDHKVNGDWPYVDDIPTWETARAEWRAIIKSLEVEVVKPPPFGN